ncbi:MAG: type II toxin-antitoxin system RelE/ParE family toxin [Synechococcales bacterium]|nr:type II toxin-antitoxin system RelE/ParE family toxin [Synechococcales bacterium]
MRSFQLTPEASRDMERIADDLANFSGLPSSDQFLSGITKAISRLTRFPHLGYQRDDLSPGIRSLIYKKYLILYRVNGESLEILRIVQGSQNLENLFP